jgi:hypothetical protein
LNAIFDATFGLAPIVDVKGIREVITRVVSLLHDYSLKLATKAMSDHLPICLFAVGAGDEATEPFCRGLARIQTMAGRE